MSAPDRAFDPKRQILGGVSNTMDRIQEEKVGRAMATPGEAHTAGWSVNPETPIHLLNAIHNANGMEFPMSGAALSSYRAEKGLPQ